MVNIQLTKPSCDEALLSSLLSDVHGHSHVHAYIFEGDEGLGKRECAVYFAAALLCQDPAHAPCGVCTPCVQSASDNNPDINRLSLSDITTKKSIGTDEIRRVISDCYIRPFFADTKIYIIEDGDSLTPQAQNAMLKILEEPPSYVVFIICTKNIGFILPTVCSRSRIVRFLPKSDAEIQRYIMSKYPNMRERASFITSLSGGIPGKADALCVDNSVFKLRDEVLSILGRLLSDGSEREIFKAAAFFEQQGKSKDNPISNTPFILDFMLSVFADMLKLRSGVTSGLTNGDLISQLTILASRRTIAQLAACIDSLNTAQQMLRRHVNHKATVLWLLINIKDTTV